MERYLILDRDGTIIADKGYVHKIEDLVFLPGAIEGLLKFKKAGFKFIVITNQAGIARGFYTREDANIFNNEFIFKLQTAGVNIEKIYFCPHHPQLTGECSCRKPKLGLVELAEKELGFKARHSIVIGDKDSDMELGKNCGALTVLIENSQYPCATNPDFRAKDINHAFESLKLSKAL